MIIRMTVSNMSHRKQVRINETKGKEEEQTTNNKHVFVSVKEKITQKLWQSFKVLWAFVESAMVSMIRTLNKISKDYRYVVRVLAQEKRDVKVRRRMNFDLRPPRPRPPPFPDKISLDRIESVKKRNS